MACYRVSNKLTGEVVDVRAPDSKIACESLGWTEEHCKVKRFLVEPLWSNDLPRIQRCGNALAAASSDDGKLDGGR